MLAFTTFSEAEEAVLTALNLTVGFPIKKIEVLSITEYHGAGLMGKGAHLNRNFSFKYDCVLI